MKGNKLFPLKGILTFRSVLVSCTYRLRISRSEVWPICLEARFQIYQDWQLQNCRSSKSRLETMSSHPTLMNAPPAANCCCWMSYPSGPVCTLDSVELVHLPASSMSEGQMIESTYLRLYICSVHDFHLQFQVMQNPVLNLQHQAYEFLHPHHHSIQNWLVLQMCLLTARPNLPR